MPVDATHAPSLLFARGYDARFSPDGRFLSFISRESAEGEDEVYVAAASPSARERAYRREARACLGGAPTGVSCFIDRPTVTSSPYRFASGGQQTIELGLPVRLFAIKGKWSWTSFDISPDGRFLAIVPRLMANEQSLTVVLNWTAEVRR